CSDILKYRDKYKVPAEMIEFEITENVFLSDHDRANKILKFLKSEGFKISIDDFGVGYSSLSILNDLSFDVLKLDRSFINKDLKVNDKILLSGIIDMAGKLGIEVLCEGVETKEQLEVLQSMGCKLIQGFYFSRPLSYDKFEEFIENDKMA
ncbi:MAG: EAL domain-containing protein, partial [Parasporobacterium sp.]|nr:EAL domain-containing protein [Parasporobacterium sp.]